MGTKRTPVEATTAVVLPASLPDAQPVEQERADGRSPWIVGLGASAGGVEALLKFFRAVAPDTGCAFLVVMHLAPDRESNLAPLIGKATSMPVEQVESDTALQANRVYVAPPGHDLLLRNGGLVVEKISLRPAKSMAIDRFLMSLAENRRERVIGVVLSGADGDGTLGMKAIKSEGGFTLVQLPSSAGHPDMPLHAIAAGVVDRQLMVEEMPDAIVQIVRNVGNLADEAADPSAAEVGLLKEILEHLNTALDWTFAATRRRC